MIDRARSRRPPAPSIGWLLALALGAAAPGRAEGPTPLPTGPVAGKPDGKGPRDYPDGGTIRANSVLIPEQLREEREPQAPRAPPPLASLGSPDVLAALGPFRPEVGAWAEYSLRDTGREVGRVLVSVLPPPMPDGRFWLEIDTLRLGVLPTAVRLLSHGDPQVRGNLERVIIALSGQTIYEVPVQSLDDQRKSLKKIPDSGAQISTTAGAKVKVKPGTFTCDKIRIAKGKEVTVVWRSSEVPLFGLVRTETGARSTELVATGHTGAHTLLSIPIADEAIPPEAMSPSEPAQLPAGPASP